MLPRLQQMSRSSPTIPKSNNMLDISRDFEDELWPSTRSARSRKSNTSSEDQAKNLTQLAQEYITPAKFSRPSPQSGVSSNTSVASARASSIFDVTPGLDSESQTPDSIYSECSWVSSESLLHGHTSQAVDRSTPTPSPRRPNLKSGGSIRRHAPFRALGQAELTCTASLSSQGSDKRIKKREVKRTATNQDIPPSLPNPEENKWDSSLCADIIDLNLESESESYSLSPSPLCRLDSEGGTLGLSNSCSYAEDRPRHGNPSSHNSKSRNPSIKPQQCDHGRDLNIYPDFVNYNKEHKDSDDVNKRIYDCLISEGKAKSNEKSKNASDTKRKLGWIYILEPITASAQDYVKIGKTERDIGTRLKSWRECGIGLVDVTSNKNAFLNYSIVEKLIWAELHNMRYMYACHNPKHTQKNGKPTAHREWFKIDKERARKHIEKWTQWLQTQKPFNKQGHLTDYWQWEVELLIGKLDNIDWNEWTDPGWTRRGGYICWRSSKLMEYLMEVEWKVVVEIARSAVIAAMALSAFVMFMVWNYGYRALLPICGTMFLCWHLFSLHGKSREQV